MKTLLVRADASMTMGTGHVMRTLALAQAWQDAGGRVVYVMIDAPEGILQRLRQEEVEVETLAAEPGSLDDARQTVESAIRHEAAWVVVDGYQFNGDYQKAIKAVGLKLLVMDDYGHAEHYWGDLVLNQNMHAEEGLYRSCEPYTKYLLGTQYALLRREFWEWRGWKRTIPERPRNIMVTFGGSDPDNVTSRVVEAIRELFFKDVSVRVIVGSGNRHVESMKQLVESLPNYEIIVNAQNMPELISQADMAITAGGSTLWEMALLALPSIVVAIAPNQMDAVRIMAERSQCRYLGPHESVSSAILSQTIEEMFFDRCCRESLSDNIATLVDGFGSQRVCRILEGTDQ